MCASADNAIRRRPNAELLVQLSRRERQILRVLYRRGPATAAEIRRELPEPPTYSAVRAHLRTLERKGYAQHQQQGLRHVFAPIVPRDAAAIAMLRDVVATFFSGSVERTIQALEALRECGPDK